MKIKSLKLIHPVGPNRLTTSYQVGQHGVEAIELSPDGPWIMIDMEDKPLLAVPIGNIKECICIKEDEKDISSPNLKKTIEPPKRKRGRPRKDAI